MDIFNMTPEAMAEAITRQMEQMLSTGTDEVVRLRKELEKTPQDAEVWFDLGLSLNQAGLQYEGLAVRLAEMGLGQEETEEGEETPIQEDVTPCLGFYKEALSAFDRVRELSPDYYGVECQRGLVYANLRDLPHAEECYLKALEEDDEDFTAAFYLSQVYHDMGKEDLAEKYQKIADELNAANTDESN